MGAYQSNLHFLLANRHSPEAQKLWLILLQCSERHASWIVRASCRGVLTEQDAEDVAANVLMELLDGLLATFRGEREQALIAFVRTVTIRKVMKLAESRNSHAQREHEAYAETPPAAEADPTLLDDARLLREIAADPRGLDPAGLGIRDDDLGFLRELFQAGSQAELARRLGVERSTVLRRIERLREIVDELCARDRIRLEGWLASQ